MRGLEDNPDHVAIDKDKYLGVWRPHPGGALLRLGGGPLSCVYSRPSRERWAVGVGVAGEGVGRIEWVGEPAPLLVGPFFGGWAFDPLRLWPGFAAERWVLPQVLAMQVGGRAILAAFGSGSEAELTRHLDDAEATMVEPEELPSAKRVLEGPQSYSALVGSALEAIDEGAFEKLVVARAIRVSSEAPFSERRLLKTLEARNPSAVTFLLRGTDGSAFVGATPETLLEARGSALETEALAGTAPLSMADALADGAKNLHEHALVVKGIVAALSPVADDVQWSPRPGLRRLSTLAHLHTPIHGRLKAGVDALDVAKALHPTAAVAGTPATGAVPWLRAHEGFVRGWYGGVVGARGESMLSAHVGLRSALLVGSTATVMVGAGVVAGSDPRAEWEETEAKAETMLTALGVRGGDVRG